MRMLAGDASAHASYPIIDNDALIPSYRDASSLSACLSQIEISRDGDHLYYQPYNGGSYRIKIAYVEATLTDSSLVTSLDDYAEPLL